MTEAQEPPGETVRGLMRRAERAALATALARDGSAWPYGSLVLIALDHDASPLLLLSDLADHTRNLAADPRVGLLFDGTAGWRDPLAGARACVLGRIAPAPSVRLLARYVARHPGAEAYAGFGDMKLYRVAVERAHLVAGFGRVHWLGAEEVLLDAAGAEALAEAEAEILGHMNQDHAAAVQLIARQVLGLDGEGWRLVGIDPEGCDLALDGALARADFDKWVADAEGARVELVRLTKRARRLAAGTHR
jgi:putative heme iron utilization protein